MPVNRRALLPALLLGALLAESSAVAGEPTKQECVSASESAQDLRDAGKLREARARFAVCAADSCPAPVREDCSSRLSDVDKAMPSLVFEARDGSDREVGAVRVTMDGELLATQLDGTPIPVDPGQHRFVLEAKGLPLATRTLVVREGDKKRHERIALVAAPVAPTASGLNPGGGPGSEPRQAGEKPAVQRRAQRTAGLLVAGVGVVGLAIGSVFGLVSKSTYDHALQSECGPAAGFAGPLTCDPIGYREVQSAHSQATAATVSFIAGGALLGAGALMYLTVPKAGRVSVGPIFDSGGAALTARAWW